MCPGEGRACRHIRQVASSRPDGRQPDQSGGWRRHTTTTTVTGGVVRSPSINGVHIGGYNNGRHLPVMGGGRDVVVVVADGSIRPEVAIGDVIGIMIITMMVIIIIIAGRQRIWLRSCRTGGCGSSDGGQATACGLPMML